MTNVMGGRFQRRFRAAAAALVIMFLGATGGGVSLGARADLQAPSVASDGTHWLMPQPASMKTGQGRVPISTSTTIGLSGFGDDRLRAAVDRMMRRLEGRTGYTMAR